MEAAQSMLARLRHRPSGYGLETPFYKDDAFFGLDLDNIFHKQWIFAGHEAELSRSGDWFALQVGKYPVVVVKTKKRLERDEMRLRAYHNVCAHRGHKVCKGTKGRVKGQKLVCPYHQWSYDVESGRLKFARDMGDHFDMDAFGLKPVHVKSVGGLIYVCVAEEPVDFEPVEQLQAKYSEPFDLKHAKIAHQERVVEKGNWKLVMENNRECYHCAKCHPELERSFPSGPSQSAASPEERAFATHCESNGYPGIFRAAKNFQFRAMKLDFANGAHAMTQSGLPAVANGEKRLGRMPHHDTFRAGTTLWWQHWMADHAVTFRVLPISTTETELVSTWLVSKDAEEGVDYDLATLTEVWRATNEQDTSLVEGVAEGVGSPEYVPGPYSQIHETGVIEFVDWYQGEIESGLERSLSGESRNAFHKEVAGSGY
eukprot:g239.t1